MKKHLFVLASSLFVLTLSACGGGSETDSDESLEDEIMEDLDQITYRYIEAVNDDVDSFEEKSSLQAALKKRTVFMKKLNLNIMTTT